MVLVVHGVPEGTKGAPLGTQASYSTPWMGRSGQWGIVHMISATVGGAAPPPRKRGRGPLPQGEAAVDKVGLARMG